MKNIVEVRGVRIGEGIPKIIVPVVGTKKEEILEAADAIREVRHDIVEWRADWFEDAGDPAGIGEVLEGLRRTLDNTPLLFTFRTAREGGQKEIGPSAYEEVNRFAAGSGCIDLLDVELFSGEAAVRKLLDCAHAAGVRVILSSHDFQKTPPKEELLGRLRRMQVLGADILKIAVMPRCRRDVLTLLQATEEMADDWADRPLITMSMGGAGLISRVSGEFFGSACTFGAVGKASAPGQMDAADLDAVLRLLHAGAGESPV